MKNYVSISLFIFWAVVVAILTAGLVFYDQNKAPLMATTINVSTSSPSTEPEPEVSVTVTPKTATPAVKTVSPKPKPTTPVPAPPPPIPTPVPPPASGGTITLTLAEVAKHNNRNDCWLVIGGNVYNVASYLSAHPGGVSIVLPYCGQPDASQAFATRGGTGTHSPSAQAMLANYLIGPLNQTVSAGQATAPTTNPPAQPVFSGDDDENDD